MSTFKLKDVIGFDNDIDPEDARNFRKLIRFKTGKPFRKEDDTGVASRKDLEEGVRIFGKKAFPMKSGSKEEQQVNADIFRTLRTDPTAAQRLKEIGLGSPAAIARAVQDAKTSQTSNKHSPTTPHVLSKEEQLEAREHNERMLRQQREDAKKGFRIDRLETLAKGTQRAWDNTTDSLTQWGQDHQVDTFLNMIGDVFLGEIRPESLPELDNELQRNLMLWRIPINPRMPGYDNPKLPYFLEEMNQLRNMTLEEKKQFKKELIEERKNNRNFSSMATNLINRFDEVVSTKHTTTQFPAYMSNEQLIENYKKNNKDREAAEGINELTKLLELKSEIDDRKNKDYLYPDPKNQKISIKNNINKLLEIVSRVGANKHTTDNILLLAEMQRRGLLFNDKQEPTISDYKYKSTPSGPLPRYPNGKPHKSTPSGPLPRYHQKNPEPDSDRSIWYGV